MAAFTESVVEEAALAWLKPLGYSVLHGPDIAPGELLGAFAIFGRITSSCSSRRVICRTR